MYHSGPYCSCACNLYACALGRKDALISRSEIELLETPRRQLNSDELKVEPFSIPNFYKAATKGENKVYQDRDHKTGTVPGNYRNS